MSGMLGDKAQMDVAFHSGSNAYCRERAAQRTDQPEPPLMLAMQGTERAAWFNGWRFAMTTRRGHAYAFKGE